MTDDETAERALSYAQGVSRMIRVRTVYDPDDGAPFDELHRVFEGLFPHLFATCPPMHFNGALLFHWKGRTPEGALMLMSHQDVVDAQEGWTHDPFGGNIAEGRVWGRGALDIKANLFCILQAAEELAARGFTPVHDLYIATSDCEEIGGNDLIADYLRESGADIDLLVDEGSAVAFCPYPGISDRAVLVSVAEKGSANFKCTAHGRGGHAMCPGKHSPLPRLGAFMAAVDESGIFEDALSPETRSILAAAAAAAERQGSETGAAALRTVAESPSPEVDDELGALMETTGAFTSAGTEGPAGSMPTAAWGICNTRIAPGHTVEEVQARLTEMAASYGIEVEQVKGRNPSILSPCSDHRFMRVERAAQVAYPGTLVLPYLLAGGTDCKHFIDIAKSCLRFTALEIDPDQQPTIHGTDENIRIDTLSRGIDFFKSLIADGE